MILFSNDVSSIRRALITGSFKGVARLCTRLGDSSCSVSLCLASSRVMGSNCVSHLAKRVFKSMQSLTIEVSRDNRFDCKEDDMML